MTVFSPVVRRSTLMVPILDRAAVDASGSHGADAVLLDIAGAVPAQARGRARALLPDAIAAARRGGAEVFVRIDPVSLYADVKAAVCYGLTGVMLPGAETAADVRKTAEALAVQEREAGIAEGRLEIVLLLGTPAGVWNVRELLHASTRVSAVAIDEAAVCQAMGIVPSDEVDPLMFCRGRVIVETLAAIRVPLGLAHPLAARPRQLAEDEVVQQATVARNNGFKGAICLYPSWVEPCNRAFTPTEEQVAYYREVRAAFAAGVARGTAVVPFRGRMIDVPVDERAKDMIELWERCVQRDREKAALALSLRSERESPAGRA